jgi:hypothetical protein
LRQGGIDVLVGRTIEGFFAGSVDDAGELHGSKSAEREGVGNFVIGMPWEKESFVMARQQIQGDRLRLQGEHRCN